MTSKIVEEIDQINVKLGLSNVYTEQCSLIKVALAEMKDAVVSIPDNEKNQSELTDILELLKQLSNVIDEFKLVNWQKTCFSTPITKPFGDLQDIMDTITEHFQNLNPSKILKDTYKVLDDSVANDLKSIYGILSDPKRLEEPEVKKKLKEIREYLIIIYKPLDIDIPKGKSKEHKHHHHKKGKKSKSEPANDNDPTPKPHEHQEEEDSEFNDFDNIQTYKIKKSDYIQDQTPIISTINYKVYTGKLKSTKEKVTITVLDQEKNSEEKFKRFYNVLTAVHHPNLETFIGAVESPLPYVFVTRRNGEKLRDVIKMNTQKNKRKLTYEILPGQRTVIAFNVASAMAYLHSLNIIHRDLSCSTILVDKSMTPRITNFANSRFFPEETSSMTLKPVSSSYFIAPELTIVEEYNEAVDVFSFGGILYELAVGKAPFSGLKRAEIEEKIGNGDRPLFPENVPTDLRDLIEKCWSQDPSKRPTFSEIVDTMLSKKVAFLGDEGTEILDQFYSSKLIKNVDLKNDIDILESICEQIQNSKVYMYECIRIRPLLLGYRYLLQTSNFAAQEETALNDNDYIHLNYLRTLLENLSDTISMTDTDKWLKVVWYMPVTEITKNIHSLMEQIYIEMTELGFTVTKYDYSNSDLLNDYRLLYILFSNNGDEAAKEKVDEIVNFMKDRKIDISTTENVIDERIKNILVRYKDYRIDKNDFEKLNYIAGGVSASVYLGRQKSTGKIVAIKEFFKYYLENDSSYHYLKNEIFFLCQLKNHYLAKFIGFNNEPGEKLWLVTKFYENGNLYQMNKEKKLDPLMKTKISFEIAQGMKYLHSIRVIHRDLKTSNILMDKDLNPKITDFGYARNNLSLCMTNQVGTKYYMAPEVILGNSYGFKADVFSFGMILYELYSGKHPYSWLNEKDVMDAIINNEHLRFHYEISQSLKKLIADCIETDQNKRPSFEEILKRMIDENISFNGASEKDVREYYEMKKDSIESEKLEMNHSSSLIFDSQIINF